jgi:hypothetical protein
MFYTTKGFWKHYYQLPKEIQKLADKNFELLKKDARHPSLQFKKIDRLYSARVGIHYRTLGIEKEGKLYWIWIGSHEEYNNIVKRLF